MERRRRRRVLALRVVCLVRERGGGEGGEMVVGFVFVGVALAIFMFWRFQMRELAGSMNKKIR